MTSSRERQADSDMFALAREALRVRGHDRLSYKPKVIALVRTYILDDSMPDVEAVRLFVSIYGATRKVERLSIARDYSPDRAMQLAAKRAQVQPRIIGVN
jgi:hypothetical protein